MSTSQNGWPVDASGAKQDRTALLGAVTVPNGVLKGDVATVFRWLAAQYDARVERLKAGTCWGWYVKQIEGGTSVSNHASGTAVDFNADRHPMGAAPSGSFSAAQIAACRAIVAEAGGVLRWGGDYSGRKDAMHWEINASAARVKAFADKIRNGDDDVTDDDIKRIADAVIARLDAAPIRLTNDAGVRQEQTRTLGGTMDADAKRIAQISTDIAAIKAKVLDEE